MKHLASTFVSLLALCGPLAAPAFAQSGPQTEEQKKDAAKQYVNAAIAAQNQRDYDTALQLYAKAYALVPHPTLIFNMAQAHRLAGHIDKALELYDEYLKKDPNGPQAQTARDNVKELTDKRAADKKFADDMRAARLKQAQKEAAQNVADEPPDEPHDEPKRYVTSPGRNLRIGGIVCGSAGVVAIGVGIGFALHARTLSNELSENGATYDQDKVDSGERADALGIGGIILGAALVGTGAYLYWSGSHSHESSSVSYAPYVTPDGAGFAIGGSL